MSRRALCPRRLGAGVCLPRGQTQNVTPLLGVLTLLLKADVHRQRSPAWGARARGSYEHLTPDARRRRCWRGERLRSAAAGSQRAQTSTGPRPGVGTPALYYVLFANSIFIGGGVKVAFALAAGAGRRGHLSPLVLSGGRAHVSCCPRPAGGLLELTACRPQVLTCLLTEQRLVFFSSNWALLTLVAECFLAYLHPLQWQHTLVPILSEQMLDFVMAPTSFLMGCHLAHFDDVSKVRDPPPGRAPGPREPVVRADGGKLL